ncbi:cupin domain-containing protein [Chitinivibrio alkaliphilus]|uniref:Mannose-6-phosphate isomerase n=1 Tax=Chitinivibrio alkaliphilus ACht1 TaxID=1313304 RepID=U7D935_9BACT|nr:cupin domain-containing protein [Chitinivibrio alkaliphilus]ERP32096.1 Mannose-6-phosphate isomerase [Chitinivibrio alkaliphilus ACht1]
MAVYKKVTVESAEKHLWGNAASSRVLVEHSHVSIAQRSLSSGLREVAHYHRAAWQFFYILSGGATLSVDGEEIALEAQEGIEIPAGATHQMRNTGEGELHYLVVSTPDSRHDRVEV